MILLFHFFLIDTLRITNKLQNMSNERQNNICLKATKLCPIYEEKSENVRVTAEGIEKLNEVNGDLRINPRLMDPESINSLTKFLKSTPALKCKVLKNVYQQDDYFYFLIFMLKPSTKYPLFVFHSIRTNVYYPEYKIYNVPYLE